MRSRVAVHRAGLRNNMMNARKKAKLFTNERFLHFACYPQQQFSDDAAVDRQRDR